MQRRLLWWRSVVSRNALCVTHSSCCRNCSHLVACSRHHLLNMTRGHKSSAQLKELTLRGSSEVCCRATHAASSMLSTLLDAVSVLDISLSSTYFCSFFWLNALDITLQEISGIWSFLYYYYY